MSLIISTLHTRTSPVVAWTCITITWKDLPAARFSQKVEKSEDRTSPHCKLHFSLARRSGCAAAKIFAFCLAFTLFSRKMSAVFSYGPTNASSSRDKHIRHTNHRPLVTASHQRAHATPSWSNAAMCVETSTTLHQAAEKAVAAAAHVERRPRRSQKTTSTAQSARRRRRSHAALQQAAPVASGGSSTSSTTEYSRTSEGRWPRFVAARRHGAHDARRTQSIST